MSKSYTYEDLNAEIRGWANRLKTVLKSRVPKRTGRLQKSIKANLRKRQGMAQKIAFGFERYGVFVEYGTGSGYKKGVKLPSRTENRKNLRSKLRTPRPWFDNTMNENIQELSDITGGFFAEIYTQNILIKKDVIK